jgi:hypothetical protein
MHQSLHLAFELNFFFNQFIADQLLFQVTEPRGCSGPPGVKRDIAFIMITALLIITLTLILAKRMIENPFIKNNLVIY